MQKVNQISRVLLTCPCCQQKRDAIKETPLTKLEDQTRSEKPLWWMEAGWSIEYAAKDKLRCACSACLKKGRALDAHPWAQNFVIGEPYFAFYDAHEHCVDCKQPFVFSAKEQQFWYEELQFLVQVWPKCCLDCRYKRRERKREQKAQMEASPKKKKPS